MCCNGSFSNGTGFANPFLFNNGFDFTNDFEFNNGFQSFEGGGCNHFSRESYALGFTDGYREGSRNRRRRCCCNGF